MAAGTGPVAVVVSVADAVGRACALKLAGTATVVEIVDPDAEVGRAVAAEVAAAGGRARAHQAGLTDAVALEEVARSVAVDHDAVQVLVNCHFALDWSSLRASTVQDWHDVVATNVLGPVLATKAFLPLLERAAGAAVVHLGSIDGVQGNPRVPSYSASKGAIPPLTHVMADELAAAGIRVNCVARAAVSDAAGPAPPDDLLRAALDCTPLRRPAAAEEVAAVVAFLAGGEASYVTGSTIVVDGGRSGLTPGTALPRP